MAGSHLASLGVPAAVTALLPPNYINWIESALNAGGDIHQVKVRAQHTQKTGSAHRFSRCFPDAPLIISRAHAIQARVYPSLLAQITLFHSM